jgi:hypothetical protein
MAPALPQDRLRDGDVSRDEELRRRIARVRPSRHSGNIRPPRIFWMIEIDWR